MAEAPQQQQPTWTPQQIEAWRKRIRDARKGARNQAPGAHIWAKPTGSHRTIQRRGQNIRVKQKPGQMMSTGGGMRSANPYLDDLHALRRGTDAPVRLGKMSWKGHGASPGNREKRRQERAIRHQGATWGKAPVMGKAPSPQGLDYLKPHKRPEANQGQAAGGFTKEEKDAIDIKRTKDLPRILASLNKKERDAWDAKSREDQDGLILRFKW